MIRIHDDNLDVYFVLSARPSQPLISQFPDYMHNADYYVFKKLH